MTPQPESTPAPARISETSAWAASAWESFKLMMAHHSKVHPLSGLDLIREVETRIEYRFKTGTYERALLDELISRYEKLAEVKRPEDDFTEPTEAELAEVDAIEAEIEANRDKVIYYVARDDKGLFMTAHDGPTKSLRDALRFTTREDTHKALSGLAYWTVVGVTP